jgi:hypothetical protein
MARDDLLLLVLLVCVAGVLLFKTAVLKVGSKSREAGGGGERANSRQIPECSYDLVSLSGFAFRCSEGLLKTGTRNRGKARSEQQPPLPSQSRLPYGQNIVNSYFALFNLRLAQRSEEFEAFLEHWPAIPHYLLERFLAPS